LELLDGFYLTRIPLKENDIEFGDDEVHGFNVRIYSKKPIELKSQILQDHEIVNRLREKIDWLKKYGKNVYSPTECNSVVQHLEVLIGDNYGKIMVNKK